jgi:hypothetical protein
MTYRSAKPHILRSADATPVDRALVDDLTALLDAGLVAPVEGPDGQLRIGLAEEPEPSPPLACRARPDGRDLAPLAELPVPVEVALVDAEPAFVVARSGARGVCSVAGPVLRHAVERVLGLPVVIATPRGVGGLLLLGEERHARAAARLDLAALRWTALHGAREPRAARAAA